MRLLLLTFAVAVALPALAAAQTRAIVGSFEGGRDGAQARHAVTNALDGVVAIASRDSVNQAARDAGESASTPAGLLAAARALRAELVITGGVVGRGARARTTIIVSSVDGTELGRTLVGPPFGRVGQQRIGNAAITVVQEAENELARQRQAFTTREQTWPQAAMTAAPPPEPPARAVGAPPWVKVMVGLDVRTHDASVQLATGAVRSYSAGIYPELGALLEIHPLNSLGAAGAGFYLRGEGGISVGINSEIDPGQPPLATTTWRLAGGLGYLGLIADGIVGLGGSIMFGADGFQIDDNTIYPSTTFSYARFGADVRFALVKDLLTLGAGGGYRVVLGTGGLGDPFAYDPGTGDPTMQFGISSSSGWDVRIELGGALEGGFTWALRFGFERYHHVFDISSDGDFGTDESIRFGAFAGWSFW